MRTIHLVRDGERVYCDVCRHPVEGYVKFAHGGQLHEARHVVRLCLGCLREAAVGLEVEIGEREKERV